ncbi:hypothetical protein [Marilutibacter chinensis]|uniref:Uncharacterized protein n=1 Tax=Marilutibacter chinensis TaxID=2912247 RepID=A0ABS9HUG9_9GAMM|nr:hypothetical protein [Lysobacter chinensis]MCF7221869.1 hypothetical protein [Lysobacter chinensis]
MEGFLEGHSIIGGVVRYHDLAYLLATDDALIEEGVAHTRVIVIDQGDWGGYDLDWLAGSAAVCQLPEEKFVLMERKGSGSWMCGGGEISGEVFDPALPPPSTRGYIRELRAIADDASGGMLYAAGTCRQLYRRDAPGRWTRLDIWGDDDSDELLERSFESVDGYSTREIYTVGWEGEIWTFDGMQWQQLDSPTGRALYKVVCAPDGTVYAAGSEGVLVAGRGNQWRLIDHGATEEDIWGLAWFEGSLYLSTMEMLYRLVDGRLVPVDFGDCDIPSTCHHLSAADGVLWSIGAQDVLRFDGTEWTRIH